MSVILPAYQEAEGIAEVLARVERAVASLDLSHELVVVDDGSTDGTGDAARAAGARVIPHPYNIGNGAAVKTGIRNARGRMLVLLDADGQHPPEAIPALVSALATFDMAVGARTGDSDSAVHRNLANAVYNGLATYVSGRKIEDLTSGFRAVRASVAREFVNLLPNTFSYPSTLTLALLRSGYSMTYVPVTAARRKGKSKIRLLRDGLRFLLIILKIATLFSPMKIFFPVSLAMLLAGLGYGLVKIFALHEPYGPTSAMLISMSVLVFLVGLVSEQVAQLKMDSVGPARSWPPEDDTDKRGKEP